jgi:riboflavin biosynthesis pyrimidine reductase
MGPDLATAVLVGLLDVLEQRPELLERLHPLFEREPEPVLVDRTGLARALNTSPSSVDRLREQGAPTIMVGSQPRFDVQEVVAWLRERGRGPRKIEQKRPSCGRVA